MEEIDFACYGADPSVDERSPRKWSFGLGAGETGGMPRWNRTDPDQVAQAYLVAASLGALNTANAVKRWFWM